MPRIRSLKPEFASDAKLSRVSRDARLTFALMITQSDDEGLLPGAHRQVLGLLYPLDDTVSTEMLHGWIEELVAIGAVRWRSTRDGVPVLQIVNWAKHQRISNAGRSQLKESLAPTSEDSPQLAETRGEPPQLAETRGLEGEGDLRPLTYDQGGGSEDRAARAAPTDKELRAIADRLIRAATNYDLWHMSLSDVDRYRAKLGKAADELKRPEIVGQALGIELWQFAEGDSKSRVFKIADALRDWYHAECPIKPRFLADSPSKPPVIDEPKETPATAAHSRWLGRIGAVGAIEFFTALTPAIAAQPGISVADAVNAVEAFADAMSADDLRFRAKWTVKKFASELPDWVRVGKQDLVDEYGMTTERGRRAGIPA